MNVILKNGKQGVVTIEKATTCAYVEVEGRKHVVAFVRDNKKVVIKNDLLLNQGDLNSVKAELNKFIKKEDLKAKKRK